MQWAAVRTTFGRTSVPEQKSNQSLPTFNCRTPTFAYVFAVSDVPPMTAAAGAAMSSATTTIAAAKSLPEPCNNRICSPFRWMATRP